MNVKDYIADSRLALVNGEYQTALDMAKKAISEEPQNPEGYDCAGDAAMSMEQYDRALEFYKKAVEKDKNNGNRYFMLGYVCAVSGKAALALKYLTIAEEMGCSKENTTQLYTLLGILCFDINKYDDALVNFEKAEQIIGIDLDILQRKAVIYGLRDDIRKGVRIANQIKLINPSSYTGYKIAFKLLMQGKHYEEAANELKKAAIYTAPSMDFVFDKVTYEIACQQEDGKKEHFDKALSEISEALDSLKPMTKEVVDSYINAAEIYLQKEDPDNVTRCLLAAENPVDSFNSGFPVIPWQAESVPELTEYDVEKMLEEDRQKIHEEYDSYGVREVVEQTPEEYDGTRDYMTTLDFLRGTEPSQEEKEEPDYELKEEPQYTEEITDQINRLYIGAYTLKKDYPNIIVYARRLSGSADPANSYIGKYSEAKAMKDMGDPAYEKKYFDLEKYFRAEMIKNPGDFSAATYRIQCYIDIGKFEEAEQLCSLLTPKLREPLLEQVRKSREEGIRS